LKFIGERPPVDGECLQFGGLCTESINQIKNIKATNSSINAENFVKIVQRIRPLDANLWANFFKKLTALGVVIPRFCTDTDKCDIWRGKRT